MTDHEQKTHNDAFVLLEMLHKSEQNPVYVWEAIARASLGAAHSVSAISLPAWVLDYLAQVSFEIMALCEEPPKRIGPALSKALGFAGTDAPSNPFKNAQKIAHEFRLAMEVHLRIYQGDKEYIAIDDVATARGMPQSTVRRAYKGWKARMEQHEALLDSEK